MSAEPRDPLERLADAWAGSTPPPIGGDLADEPADVRAAVEHVRAALATRVPSPAATERARSALLSAAARRRRAAPRPAWAGTRRRPAFALVLAAATVLALVGAAWWLLRAPQAEPRAEFAAIPEAPEGPVAPANDGDAPRTPSSPSSEEPRVLAVAADRIEIGSGNVRLVLLTDRAPETEAEDDD